MSTLWASILNFTKSAFNSWSSSSKGCIAANLFIYFLSFCVLFEEDNKFLQLAESTIIALLMTFIAKASDCWLIKLIKPMFASAHIKKQITTVGMALPSQNSPVQLYRLRADEIESSSAEESCGVLNVSKSQQCALLVKKANHTLGCIKRVQPLSYNNNFKGSFFIKTFFFLFSLGKKKSCLMNVILCNMAFWLFGYLCINFLP